MTHFLSLQALGINVIPPVEATKWQVVYSKSEDKVIGWCWPIDQNHLQPKAQLDKMFVGLKLELVDQVSQVDAWLIMGDFILDKDIRPNRIKMPTLLEIQNNPEQKNHFWRQWCELLNYIK